MQALLYTIFLGVTTLIAYGILDAKGFANKVLNIQRISKQRTPRGFALPTVLIASVVLLTVLAVSITATTAVRTALKDQYYAQLAQVAGEAGVAYAKACLAANGNVPLWTDAKPLKPSTDCSGNDVLSPQVSALVVAGGGGGANTGGGGGAGGYIYNEGVPISAGTYAITVGNGGAGGSGCNGCNGAKGQNSVFSTITAEGGGYGGTHGNSQGGSGGSGGGTGQQTGAYGANNPGGSGTVGQGNNGGDGFINASWNSDSAGGGGAGSAGTAGGTASPAGAGGEGLVNTITGASVYYAAGGGGGEVNSSPGIVGLGGSGIGGNGVVNAAGTAGRANTGSGGGGGSYTGSYFNGGAGGSGIVVISYPDGGAISATGGNSEYVSGGRKIHVFTSGGNFVVSTIGAACPSDTRCFVAVNGNVRSSFSVPRPTVDADGKALTIANSGYVEITRSSTGAVWRTYTQPSVQAAVVPDLCSGATATGLGWSNAVRSSTQDSYSPASSAQTVTLSNTAFNAGPIYFRKDFTVQDAGVYDVAVLAPTTSDQADIYVDGVYKVSSTGSLSATTMNLTAGCHTVFAQLTNTTATTRVARFTASIQRQGSTAPVVVTNSSWRVSVGESVHFSSPKFYADPSLWTAVRDIQSAVSTNAEWLPVSGEASARYVATTHNLSGSSYPAASYAYFMDPKVITVSSATPVKVTMGCDDSAIVYMDGLPVLSTSTGGTCSALRTANITLQPGSHRFGIALYNISGPAGIEFAAVRTSDGAVLTLTDSSWLALSTWTTTSSDPYSYDKDYIPSSSSITLASANLLIVGGGGGGGNNHGGGGGGGGVVDRIGASVKVGSYPVVVGAGGAGGAGSAGAAGGSGGNSSFNGIYAVGGGGGGGRITTNSVSTPRMGGGGAGTIDGATGQPGAGAAGLLEQGNKGGNGSSNATAGNGGGGGGAGALGGDATGSTGAGSSGAGGNGRISTITGSSLYYGGGGSGGRWDTGTVGVAGLGGGGLGGAAAGASGGAGVANTGGGGGGGGSASGNGGAGGSGVVIIAYPTGTLTATGGVITTSGGMTIHRFTSSGTFTITSIN